MNTENRLQLVTFEQAKRLRALGFDWGTDFYWSDTPEPELCHAVQALGDCEFIPAPTVAHALKWVRDVKKIFFKVDVIPVFDDFGKFAYEFEIRNYETEDDEIDYEVISGDEIFYAYEAAESALLDELLTLLEKEK